MVVDGEAVSIMNYIIQKRQREKYNSILPHYVNVVDPIIIPIIFPIKCDEAQSLRQPITPLLFVINVYFH